MLLSPANADAQNARAKIPTADRTDQPHMRLSLVPFPMPGFWTHCEFKQAYSPTHFVFLSRPTFTSLHKECFSPSKENVRGECCSAVLLLLRYGCPRLRRACRRSRRRISTWNLPPTVALR